MRTVLDWRSRARGKALSAVGVKGGVIAGNGRGTKLSRYKGLLIVSAIATLSGAVAGGVAHTQAISLAAGTRPARTADSALSWRDSAAVAPASAARTGSATDRPSYPPVS